MDSAMYAISFWTQYGRFPNYNSHYTCDALCILSGPVELVIIVAIVESACSIVSDVRSLSRF